VVGCPRSGTTLVQSIIAGHPGLESLPESHVSTAALFFFPGRLYGAVAGLKVMSRYFVGWLRAKCAYTPHNLLRYRIPLFLERAGFSDDKDKFESLPSRSREILTTFVRFLDSHAGSEGWVEKTPNNVFCLRLIEKYVPDAHVIRVIRDGEATVASIVDAAKRYKDWNERYLMHANNLKRIVALWNRDVRISLQYKEKPKHLLVSHKKLTADPKSEVSRIFSFLGLPYSDGLLSIRSDRNVTDYEKRKKNIGQKIKPQPSKFCDIFTEDEQNDIKRMMMPVNRDVIDI
jgi:hypothetical protein